MRAILLTLVWCVALVAGGETVHAAGGASDTDPATLWQGFLSDAYQLEPTRSFPYESCFRRAAKAHNIPVVLLLAVARGESDFDPLAKSKANARGLMQILWPTTARHLGISRLSELHEPCTNVDAGARYLKELLARYAGNVHRALAAYNYGPNRIAVADSRMPAGARWYSGYIHRHLSYVIGAPKSGQKLPYAREGKYEVIAFNKPYRAQAFVATLKTALPEVRIDWFRSELGLFRVVIMYEDPEELTQAKQGLRRAGFVVL